MKLKTTLLAGALLIAATSIAKTSLKGEGPDISDKRSPGSFTKVESLGSNNVYVVKDKEYKVIVTGHQNLVPEFETSIKNGTLKLKFKDKYNNVKNNNIKIEVHMPAIEYFAVTGSGNAVIDGSFAGDMEADVTGSGNINIKSGKFAKLKTEVTGSGNIDASGSSCSNGYAEISGSGDIKIQANASLSVDISGSGNVHYWGNPSKTDFDVSGSGRVSKKG